MFLADMNNEDSNNHNYNHEDNNNNKGDNHKRVQCYECEGFGHNAAEYANTLKKNNKSLVASWSANDSESSKAEDEVNILTFNVVTKEKKERKSNMESLDDDSDDYSSDDDAEISREEIVKNYCLLNDKCGWM